MSDTTASLRAFSPLSSRSGPEFISLTGWPYAVPFHSNFTRTVPWLTPSTRETLVVLVMNGLHLYRSSPSSEEKKQDPLLQHCVDILQLMGRVGVHVADMAYVLSTLLIFGRHVWADTNDVGC